MYGRFVAEIKSIYLYIYLSNDDEGKYSIISETEDVLKPTELKWNIYSFIQIYFGTPNLHSTHIYRNIGYKNDLPFKKIIIKLYKPHD